MTLRRLVRRSGAWFMRTRLDRELNDEIEAHLELAEREAAASGLPAGEARRTARRRFGGIQQTREAHRDARAGRPFLAGLWRDLRWALRSPRRKASSTALAILTAGVAIGTSAAAYSTADYLLRRPPPGVVEPDRLLTLFNTNGQGERGFTFADYLNLKDTQDVFVDVATYAKPVGVLTSAVRTDQIVFEFVSGNYFSLLGPRAALGRTIAPEDDVPDSLPAVVVSDAIWKSHFGGDAAVLGQTVGLNGQRGRIVGVMPAGFEGYNLDWNGSSDVWLPIRAHPLITRSNVITRTGQNGKLWPIIGRLRPGVTRRVVEERAQAWVPHLTRDPGDQYTATAVGVRPSTETRILVFRDETSQRLNMLLGVSALLLLAACFNIANSQLGHAIARRRETGLRTALGATRWQVMQQILVEAAVLGTAAAAVGIVIGALLIKIGSSLPPILSRTPVASASAIDGQLVAIVALVGAFSAAGIGLAPALFVSFRSPISHPAGFKPFWSWSGFRISARQVLLAVQVALATVLALTAGLLLHSLARIAAVASDHSEPARVLTGRVTAIAVPVDQRPAFFDSLLRGLNTLPGAESASFSANRLFEIGSAPVSLPGSDHGEIPTGVGFSAAGFFATVGIPLVAGREFDGSDDDQRHGLVINRVLADRVWPGDSAIGRQVPLLGEARTVTGVITESRCRSLLGPSEPCAYLPFVPTFSGGIVHVRAQGDPMTLVQPVRDLLRELNPHVALTDVRTLDGQIRYITAAQRLSAFLSAALAAIGILLLAAGCVSLFVSMVRDSARELAIRLAVGASMGTVTRRVLLQGLALVAAGLAMGSIAGRFVAVRLAEQLHEVAPSDPLTWTLVPVLVATVSLLSVYWAGRLAARTDPAQLLRAD